MADVRRWVVAVVGTVVVLGVVATGMRLDVPSPTGPAAVGRATAHWSGPDGDVPAVVWYPSRSGTGAAAAYVPDLDRIADALVDAGGVPAAAVAGLRLVRSGVRADATPLQTPARFPVVLLSPGNQTNVAFYGTLATELASRGFVVVGIDHPGQVAAAALPDGRVVPYDPSLDVAGGVAAKVEARVSELQTALDGLAADPPAGLAGRLDLDRVAVIGHSNGGLAALELCRRQPDVVACANLDGQAAGGPLSAEEDGQVPDQPTLVLTKEVDVHPVIAERLEAGGTGTYRIVLPGAAHDMFADPAQFRPTLVPWAGRAERVATSAARLVAAFLDVHVRGADPAVLGAEAISVDAYVNAFPLNGRPMIPAA